MSASTSIQLNQLTQTVQSGGYWLISGVLSKPLDAVYAFYTLDYLEQKVENQQACPDSQDPAIHLSLFDYQPTTLKLLSHEPLSEATIQSGKVVIQAQKQSALDFSTEKTTLLMASDLGIGPLFYVAKQIKNNGLKHLALLHATQGFPFAVKPAQILLQDFPFEAIGGCSLLEDWKIANRLASELGLAGCLDGSITELLTPWLEAENQRQAETPLNWNLLSFAVKVPDSDMQSLLVHYPWIEYQAFAVST